MSGGCEQVVEDGVKLLLVSPLRQRLREVARSRCELGIGEQPIESVGVVGRLDTGSDRQPDTERGNVAGGDVLLGLQRQHQQWLAGSGEDG